MDRGNKNIYSAVAACQKYKKKVFSRLKKKLQNHPKLFEIWYILIVYIKTIFSNRQITCMCSFNNLNCGKVELKYKLKFRGQKDLDLDFFSFNNAVIIVQDTKIFLKYFFATVSPFFLKKSHSIMNIFLYCSCNAHLCYMCIFSYCCSSYKKKYGTPLI